MREALWNIALGASGVALLLASGYLFGVCTVPPPKRKSPAATAIAGTILLLLMLGVCGGAAWGLHFLGKTIRNARVPASAEVVR